MNEDTLVAVCCYDGDQTQVIHALRMYMHHECPVIAFSPTDSKAHINYPGVECRFVGKRAYIGQESLDRQRLHFEVLLSYPQKYFLLNDSDSFCLSAELPKALYLDAGVVWSNEVGEPRPHASPYPKIAMHPPYFFSRAALEKMYRASEKIRAHPITPYIDWWTLAACCEAGLSRRSFTSLEHPSSHVFRATEADPNRACWQQLDYRIRYTGTIFMHPIKTVEQLVMCEESYKGRYE